MAPKRVDRPAYRAELVERAIELFATNSYSTLSIRKIAEGLAVSTGTLYHYFDSKQAIFAAVVEHITALDTFAGEGLLAVPPDQRLEAMLAYADAHHGRFSQHLMVLAEVLQLEAADGDVLRRVRRATEAYVAGVMMLLGLPDPAAARTYLALINGLLFQSLIDGQPVRFADQAPLFRRLLARPEVP